MAVRDDRKTLTTFESWFGIDDHRGIAAGNPSPDGNRTLPTNAVAEVVPAIARVEHGRWIVDCPFCRGAEFFNATSGLFFCCGCRNAQVDNSYLAVLAPDAKTRAEIALVLCEDVDRDEWRNWNPTETVDDLRRQAEDAKRRLRGEGA